MALKLPDSAVPMGDFPVAKAVDIDFNDGENLQEKLDNGKLGGGGNTSDLTDLENRVTTNETNITDLQEQTSDLQEQIDNLDIPEDVDLTEINDKLTQLETKQINKTSIIDMNPTPVCYKITPKDNNTFSKILIVDLYGGCLLITGSIIPDYKSLKAVRLSNGCWESYSASNNVTNKIESVYYDGSYIYVNCLNYIKINFEGGFTNIERIDSTPTGATQLPILDLTQQTDLTNINTKLTQLETKANLIPVVADNPTDYDLNNYKENGNYSIGDSSKYRNVPIAQPALLTVIRSNSYRLQIYTIVNKDDVYFRKSTDWGKTWSSWVLLNKPSGASGGSDIYTDTQQECGTWMGKKLYKRSRYSTGTKASLKDSTQPIFNVDKTLYRVVKIEGVFRFGADSSTVATYQTPFIDFNKSASIVLLQDREGMICSTTKGLSEYKDYGEDVTVYYVEI